MSLKEILNPRYLKKEGIIPELYLALRIFPKYIEEQYGPELGEGWDICDPWNKDGIIKHFFKEEDIRFWEYILRNYKAYNA